MVVLVIIGVLAALIVPNVLDRADDARVTAARTDVNNLMQALKLYKLDNQRFPSAEQGLQALVAKPTVGSIPAELEALPRQAAQRSLGPALPVRQPRREGRDRCLQLGRRRPARWRRQECRRRLLAVSATPPAEPHRERLHADRAAAGGGADRHRQRAGHARAARPGGDPPGAGGLAPVGLARERPRRGPRARRRRDLAAARQGRREPGGGGLPLRRPCRRRPAADALARAGRGGRGRRRAGAGARPGADDRRAARDPAPRSASASTLATDGLGPFVVVAEDDTPECPR